MNASWRHLRRGGPLLVLGALTLLACGSDSAISSGGAPADDTHAGESSLPPASRDDTGGGDLVLARGQLRLPAATAFGAPGFHEVLTATATLPARLGVTAGRDLVVTLRDVGRPAATCASEHPLSGCATVDWSDAVSRPGVPAGGVFDNHVTLVTETGEQTFFLREGLVLAAGPDHYNPG